MALIESHACGTPIVVSTHGAPHELVDEGVTGELCEPHDVEGFAAAALRGFALARRARDGGRLPDGRRPLRLG